MVGLRSLAGPTVLGSLLIGMFAFPAPVLGERLLWMSTVPEATETSLRSSLERELRVELLPLEDAWTRIERTAARHRNGRAQAQARRAERRAREAYLHLRLGEAAQAYERSLTLVMAPSPVAPSVEDLGRLLFGRGLVHLAAAREDAALRDLWLAQRLRPNFRPDPGEYGPPIFRALARARQMNRGGGRVQLEVDRVPDDASVWIDGASVAPGQGVSVTPGGQHLLIASRIGYAPVVRWVDVSQAAREVVVLNRLVGAALASQIIAMRDAQERRLEAPGPGLRDALVRALGASGSIEARPEESSVRLIHRNAEGSTQREAVGSSVSWEAEPYTTLAASLAGRVVEPPAPSAVALTVAAPSRVDLGEEIEIQTRLVDREERVNSVVAHCDDLRVQEPAAEVVSLVLVAPEEPVDLRCDVRAVDGESRILARSPEVFEVAVETSEPTPWYARWYVWGTVAVVIAAGVTAGVVLSQQEPENVLVLRGP